MSSISSIRLSGLATGMDTDAMVKSMLTADQEKIDKAQQKEQTVKWQQEIYREVMINKKQVTTIPLTTLKEGITLYLELTQKKTEITAYIKNHEQDDINTLVTKLINRFSNYGLGDTQYMAMINEIRS